VAIADSLAAGLAALEQQQYEKAIAHLATACRTATDSTVAGRAQQGLVIAYERQEERHKAQALCKRLCQSPEITLRTWAIQTLPTLLPSVDTAPGNLDGVQGDRLNPAGRAKRWQPLPTSSRWQQSALGALQVGTAFLLVGMISFVAHPAMAWTNRLLLWLRFIPHVRPIQAFYFDQTRFILTSLALLLVLSPWLYDVLLLWFYGLESLSFGNLAQSSPEAARLLPRLWQQRLPLPKLYVLPTQLPLVFSYGFLPRWGRIVVSRGLLQGWEEDEIAVLMARASHTILTSRTPGIGAGTILLGVGWLLGFLGLGRWWIPWCIWGGLICLLVGLELAVISLVALTAQLAYLLYCQLSQGADQVSFPLARWSLAVLAMVAYGWFRLCRYVACPLVRIQTYQQDTFAVNATGNPNGLTRALLKFTQALGETLPQRGSLPLTLEGLDLLLPVDVRASVSLGSLALHTPWETLLAWDCTSPYRHWLGLNRSHPPLGDRLQRLQQCAQQWGLGTELRLTPPDSPKLTWSQGLRLIGLWSPHLGILLGVGMAFTLWGVGQVSEWLQFPLMAWMAEPVDRQVLRWGLALIGFSLGTILRFNRFFPTGPHPAIQVNPALADWYQNPQAMPLDSSRVQLQGKLLGGRGVSNWLGQDLWLETASGLLRLHATTSLGPLGFLVPGRWRPNQAVGKTVTVTGWLRRGASPWLDLASITLKGCRDLPGVHPPWSILVSIATALGGAWIIWRG